MDFITTPATDDRYEHYAARRVGDEWFVVDTDTGRDISGPYRSRMGAEHARTAYFPTTATWDRNTAILDSLQPIFDRNAAAAKNATR